MTPVCVPVLVGAQCHQARAGLLSAESPDHHLELCRCLWCWSKSSPGILSCRLRHCHPGIPDQQQNISTDLVEAGRITELDNKCDFKRQMVLMLFHWLHLTLTLASSTLTVPSHKDCNKCFQQYIWQFHHKTYCTCISVLHLLLYYGLFNYVTVNYEG